MHVILRHRLWVLNNPFKPGGQGTLIGPRRKQMIARLHLLVAS